MAPLPLKMGSKKIDEKSCMVARDLGSIFNEKSMTKKNREARTASISMIRETV
jgi:hypothetical protein